MNGTEKLIIHYDLVGEEAERFLAYMKREFIKKNAVAGRKLALERLAEIERSQKAAEV